MNKILIASFDIGKRNFAFCVEEIDLDYYKTIKNMPKIERYYKDGSPTPQFNKILKDVCIEGEILLIDNVDLTGDCDGSEYLDPKIFINMTRLLDSYKSYWDRCTSFVIEQQMGFGKKRNYMALKLGQHCFSYFSIQYANFKQVVEFPSYHKTKVLGAGKLTKYERKKWAVQKAMDILTDRDDTKTMNLINSRKKRDDAADVISQLQAYKYLMFVDKNDVK
jgi:hypothetical protein